ncbi:hypothetical protein JCGZ_25467 [Jatropha curcas]|uniref:Uncharacterized protein n=1 Tax=Jatropha curcas TaxID=180498 RepID=A0A067L4M6_JATCU|nr:hypothetical protein JCGZ_25467 [Jatropha curcas]
MQWCKNSKALEAPEKLKGSGISVKTVSPAPNVASVVGSHGTGRRVLHLVISEHSWSENLIDDLDTMVVGLEILVVVNPFPRMHMHVMHMTKERNARAFPGVVDLLKLFRDQFCDPRDIPDVLSTILAYFR